MFRGSSSSIPQRMRHRQPEPQPVYRSDIREPRFSLLVFDGLDQILRLILSKDTCGSCGRACRSEVMDSGNRHSGIGGGWQREASLRARLQELAANRVQSAVNELSGRITHEQLADADLGRHIIGKHPHCS